MADPPTPSRRTILAPVSGFWYPRARETTDGDVEQMGTLHRARAVTEIPEQNQTVPNPPGEGAKRR